MRRNLLKRLEILFPVTAPHLRDRLVRMLETYFADNVKAYRLRTDSTYEPAARKRPRVRAQEALYKEAVEANRSVEQSAVQFRPLTRPKA